MVAVSFNSLTAIGALATAVFTGITAAVTYLVYRHGRHQSAQHRPIRVSNQEYRFNDDIVKRELPGAIRDTRPKRIVVLRFTNRTDTDQKWSLDGGRTRVYGLTAGGDPELNAPTTIITPSHDGTTVGLLFVLAHDGVPRSALG
jgi:hypothetical protein